MFLRFIIPWKIYLGGVSREALDLSASFDHKGYAVRLTFPGGEVLELKDLPKEMRFVRRADGLQIVLTDKQDRGKSPPLADLFQVPRDSDLLLLMQAIGSRVCRAIRNFAVVPEMPERLSQSPVEAADVATRLRRWSPETSTTGESWTPLLPPEDESPFAALVDSLLSHGGVIPESMELKAAQWPDVVEALEDGKEPPPEQEFLTNALGHVRQGNFRLAVLESIICLEIVLTQFLRQHLAVVLRIPKKRVEKFLSRELGLTARLLALLNLTLHESYMKDIDLDGVIKVVEWRNSVMHKTGRLPRDIPEETLRKGIVAVVSLSRLLAERRDHAAAVPELMKIGDALRGKAKMAWPQIWLRLNHRVRIDIELFSIEDSANYPETLGNLAQEAAELLKKRDPRFDPNKHLMIHFKKFAGKSLGWFAGGTVRMSERGGGREDAEPPTTEEQRAEGMEGTAPG